jgi:hypothetical protein
LLGLNSFFCAAQVAAADDGSFVSAGEKASKIKALNKFPIE